MVLYKPQDEELMRHVNPRFWWIIKQNMHILPQS